jgi:hypothetical protein
MPTHANSPLSLGSPLGMPSSATVEVECIGIRLDESGDIVGRVVTAPMFYDPDVCAASIIGLGKPKHGPDPSDSHVRHSIEPRTGLLHSTAWRWSRFGSRFGSGASPTNSGCVVLTYLCVPDPEPNGSGWLVACETAGPDDDDSLSIPTFELRLEQVLEQGIRHLAWLATNQPQLTALSQRRDPKLWEAVMRVGQTQNIDQAVRSDSP